MKELLFAIVTLMAAKGAAVAQAAPDAAKLTALLIEFLAGA